MKIFYNPDSDNAGGTAPVDIAAQLAKGGVKTNDDGEVIVPNIVLENKKEEIPAPVIEKVPDPSIKEVVVEPQKQIEKAEVAPISIPTINWKEELKKAELNEVLKELGFDEKMLGFFNTWRGGGDIGNYIRAASIDYTKMTPEQLIKQQLFEEYPEFSPEDLEELYRAKVVDQYKLDPDVYSEQEVKRGKLLLTADAKKIRESMAVRQKDYILNVKAPEIPNQLKEAEAAAKQQDDDRTKALEQYKAAFEGHKVTKDLLTNKWLTIGEGEDAFNYGISDPNKVLSILQDPVQWAQTVFNADGTPQVEKQLVMSAVAIDHRSFCNEIYKAGKAKGAQQAIAQLENVKRPGAQVSTPDAPLTPAQALARNGVVTETY